MEPAENGLDLWVRAAFKDWLKTAKELLEKGGDVDVRDDAGRTALMIAGLLGHTEAAKLFLDRGAKTDLHDDNGCTALVMACFQGHTETAELLLDRDAEVDLQGEDGSTALMAACLHGHTTTAKLLLDRGAKVDLRDDIGRTALLTACLQGHIETAKFLLDRGANADLQDDAGWTVLVMTCLQGHMEAAKLLLDRGAKANLQKADGGTALMFVSHRGCTKAAELLLDRGVKVDLRNDAGWTALMLACQHGHTETAKLLLDRGAKVDVRDDAGRTALMIACLHGHSETAKLLLHRGAKADLQKADGETALMLACQHGHTKSAELLLDRGAEVDLQKPDGWTALLMASQKGHTEAVKLLLDRGAEMDLQGKDRSTAVMMACLHGHTETTKVLLDCGAKVENDETALMLACQHGLTKVAGALLDRGVKVDLQDVDGWTALMMASQKGQTKAAKLLLDRGAEVDLQTSDGWTALIWACGNGHTDAAELLLDRSAKVNLQQNDGWTALTWACHHGCTDSIKLLLGRGAKTDLQMTNGWTALMSACDKGHAEAAELLLVCGAEVNLQNTDGWTALMSACHHGHAEAAKVLLDRGAETDRQRANGWTALMWACRNSHMGAVELLLDRGAEVNLQGKDGSSALMLACRPGHTEIATLLLDHGAKTDLQKKDGSTALIWACRYGRTETAKLLLDRGAKVDLQMTNGWTALMAACGNGHTEAAKVLLDRGAAVDLQKTTGLTALMSACRNGHVEVATLLLDRGAEVNMRDGEGGTALVWATQRDPSSPKASEMDPRYMAIIGLLCTRSGRLEFEDLEGPAALAIARENNLRAIAELLEFLSESSPFAPFELPLGALVSCYVGNVRTVQAAAGLSGPELYFMGLKEAIQRRAAVELFQEAVHGEQPRCDTLLAVTRAFYETIVARARGDKALSCILEDLDRLLSLRPCNLQVFLDFDVAMNPLREVKRRLEDLQARVANNPSLVAERDEARETLASLTSATVTSALQLSIERLENNDDPAAAENICSRVWTCLFDEPLTRHGGPRPSDQDVERACQAARTAIAACELWEEVMLRPRGMGAASDDCYPSLAERGRKLMLYGLVSILVFCLGFVLFLSWFLIGLVLYLSMFLLQPTRRRELLDLLGMRLGAFRAMEKMDEVPLAEIRHALEMLARHHAAARQIELARCRNAALAMKSEVDGLVRSCSRPPTESVEGLINCIYEMQTQREALEMKLRHARGSMSRAGAGFDAGKLAKLQEELNSLPGRVFKLDRELRRERARVIRYTERFFPKLVKDPAWRQQIGLPSEALVGVGKLELWLAYVTRADFAQVKPLATKPGKEVHMVRDPDGRKMVLKSFHLANDACQRRFCQQVQALAEPEFAYFVRIQALFVDASFGNILMPYYAGGDLAAWIRDHPHASDQARKRIALGMLSGVHDLHQRKLVHCNIKSDNILLTEGLMPVLGVFESMTQPLEAADRYDAPELLVDGTCEVSPTLDLYSVGVVLSEIFPAPSTSLQDLVGKLQADDPSQRPSAFEALGHEAFQSKPMQSCLL